MTMPTRRPSIYLWPTWITSLLAGEAQCWYAPWMKAHFKLNLLDRGGFDLAAWKVQHAEMVDQRAGELRAEGYTVTLEDQNAFHLQGRAAKLGGKPDIIGVRGERGLIVDCKGGKRRDSDVQQVLIYLFAAPLAHPHLQKVALDGEVRYRDGAVAIRAEQFTPELRQRIVEAITKVGSAMVPPAAPSARECRFCDIAKTDCPARIETAAEDVQVEAF